MRRIYSGIVIVVAALACSSGASAQSGKPAAGAADTAVLSGGIGVDARDELAARARDHNLKLVFALASREYLADVDVEISGSGRKIAQRSEGPWMFVKLPPGAYTVRATVAGKTQSKQVTVGPKGQKVVNFLWPATADATGPETGSAR